MRKRNLVLAVADDIWCVYQNHMILEVFVAFASTCIVANISIPIVHFGSMYVGRNRRHATFPDEVCIELDDLASH